MRLTQPIFLGAAMLLCSAGAVSGADSTSPSRRITLADCVLLVLENNLDVKIRRLGPSISTYNLRGTYGAYDPNLGFSIGGSHRTQAAGTDQQGRPFGSRQFDTLFFGRDGGFLTGSLPFGGLSYAVGFGLSRTVSDPPFLTTTNDIFDVQYAASVALAEVRLPLLRDFWIDGIRSQIEINKEAVKGSELDLQLQIMTSLLQVEQAYYDLVFSREFIQVQQTALEAAERLLEDNRKRVEVGAMAKLEEKSAAAQAAASRAALIAAQGNYGTAQRVLKNLITDEYSPLRDVLLDPVEELRAFPMSFQVQDSWLKGLTQRPDLERLRLALRQKNIEIRYQKNQLYPVLDLVGSYGQSANNFTSFGDAFDDIGAARYPNAGIQLQFSIPLGNTSARNSLRARRAELEQALLTLKKQEQLVMVEIDNAIANARTDFERVGATREAREFAKEAWDAEQKKHDNGKSTSYEVLLKQRDYITTLSDEIRSLADYNKTLADLSFREGSTLERHNLTITVR